MSKFNCIFKDVLKRHQINESDQASPDIALPPESKVQRTSGGGMMDWLMKNIWPILLGCSSLSLLMGKGIFGIGSKYQNNKFGGWAGGLLGALGAAVLLPSAWSNKDFKTRISDTFSKFTSGQISQGFKQLFGISSSADTVLKEGTEAAEKMRTDASEIQKRKQKYISGSDGAQKIYKWLKNNKYDISEKTYLSEGIYVLKIMPYTDEQKKRFSESRQLGFIINSDKGSQAYMCTVKQAVSMINMSQVNSLNRTFTKNNLKRGLVALKKIAFSSNSVDTWFQGASLLGNACNSVNNGSKYSQDLFGNILNTVKNYYQIQLPENLTIIDEQTQTSADQIAADIQNDESTKTQDSVLNKFDEELEELEKQCINKQLQTLINSMIMANKHDPTAFLICAKQGEKEYYYARNPENNYLTEKIQETVYFSKQQVSKLQGTGDLSMKLQQTLKKIRLPQVMRMKNTGIRLYIKPVNLQYNKKVNQILQNKFKIEL